MLILLCLVSLANAANLSGLLRVGSACAVFQYPNFGHSDEVRLWLPCYVGQTYPSLATAALHLADLCRPAVHLSQKCSPRLHVSGDNCLVSIDSPKHTFVDPCGNTYNGTEPAVMLQFLQRNCRFPNYRDPRASHCYH